MRFANILGDGDPIPNGLSFNVRQIETFYVDERDTRPVSRKAVILHLEVVLRFGGFMTSSRSRFLWKTDELESFGGKAD
jgi:hypothetical protein